MVQCNVMTDTNSEYEDHGFSNEELKRYPEPNGQAMYLGDRIYV